MYPDNTVVVGSATIADPAANVTVTCGFEPRYVRCINVNNLTFYEYFEGMDAGTSLNTANHADTQISVNANNGITVSATGFTMGSDICDTAADVVRYIAFR